MSNTTLAKVTRPAFDRVYPRERLFAQLKAACQRPLVWVKGPPGSGKTTLVSSFLDTLDMPHVWYHVDEGDGDPASFFYYLRQAATGLKPEEGEALPALTREFADALGVFTRNFFREFYGLLPAESMIVLDNVHDAQDSEAFQLILKRACEELPFGINLCVISRSDPPGCLARAMASDKVSVLQWDDLRLTAEEAAGIAAMRDRPDGEAIRSLLERSDGWVAGLVLMMEQGYPSEAALPEHTANLEVLFDFFADEVFDAKDQQTRDLLIKTAYLPLITPASARALTDNADAEAVLTDLSRNNYFTMRLQGDQARFEYHPLFRAFLQHRAARQFDAEALDALKRASARRMMEDGEFESAAHLLVQVEDWKTLVPLIHNQAPKLLQQGRRHTVQHWLADLPQALKDADPWLRFWEGASLYPYDLEQSRDIVEDAYGRFRASNDYAGAYLAAVSVIETYFYVMGDFRPMDYWLQELRQVHDECPTYPSSEIESRVAYSMLSGTMWRQPASTEPLIWADKAERLLSSDISPMNKMVLAHTLLVFYTRWKGNLAKSGKIMRLIAPLVKGEKLTALGEILWHMMNATYGWIDNRPEDGRQAVEEGLQAAQRSGVRILDLLITGLGAYCELCVGNLDNAENYLERMVPLLREKSLADVAHYHYLSAWTMLARGEKLKAREHGETALRLTRESDAGISITFNLLTLAECELALGNLEASRQLTQEAIASVPGLDNGYFDIQVQLTLARLYLRGLGDYQEGKRALKQALERASQGGFITLPWLGWLREEFTELLAFALREGIEPEYAARVIRERELDVEVPPLDVADWPWTLKIHTLGDFRLEIQGKPGKINGKPAEIMRMLAGEPQGKAVSVSLLADALWPDAEGDAAHHTFETTLYRLRKQLKVSGVLIYRDGRVQLDPKRCWVDLWALDACLGRLEDAIQNQDNTEVEGNTHNLWRLYAGPPEADAEFDDSGHQRVHAAVLRMVERLGHFWESQGDFKAAAQVYQQGLGVAATAEGLYQNLMHCYHRLGWRAEALSVFEQCRQQLRSQLDLEPSNETQAIYQKIRS